MNKQLKICFMWHNLNSANYGVGALAIAHLDMVVNAAKANGISICVETVGTSGISNLSIKNDLEKRLGIKISHIGFGLRDIVRKLVSFRWGSINIFKNNHYDYVFDIGEGDSFTDIYGLKRFFVFSLSKWFAIISGVPLVISPQTIGPFRYGFTSLIAGYLMKKSVAVYVRDHKSSDYLDTMEIKHKEVSDVAFLLPFDSMPKLDNSVGINVSALLWHGGYSKSNQFNLNVDYRKLIVELINQFISRDKKVYLISHVITDEDEVEDDYRVSILLKREYFGEDDKVIVAPEFKSPIDAKSYISQMQFFIGSRMHATIGALSSGVPTIPIAYSRKFSGVFGSINYKYTIDAYGNNSNQSVIQKIFDNYDNRYDEMEKQGKQSIKTAKEKLNTYSDYLRDLLK